MKRTLIGMLCLLLGIGLLAFSAYRFITDNKTVFSTESIPVTRPQTSVTKTFQLQESDNPHQISMQTVFKTTQKPQSNETPLFTYQATLVNSRGEIVEQKNSSYIYTITQISTKPYEPGTISEDVALLTLTNVPTDSYAFTLSITPAANIPQTITLDTFSFVVKKHAQNLPVFVPVVGLIFFAVAGILLPRPKQKMEPAGEGHPPEVQA